MKAVIIDDEKAAALDLARRLEAYPDINVVGTAQGGVEGLEMLAKHNPDVLFLDIEMPDLFGIDFLERMDRQSNGRCKVVMFSAHDKYMLSAFRNQAFDFLMKPIDDADLRTVLQRVYASRKYEPTPIVQPSQDEKFLMYTGAADFRLVNLRDIGVVSIQLDAARVGGRVSGRRPARTPQAHRKQRLAAHCQHRLYSGAPKIHHQHDLSYRGNRQPVSLLSPIR